MAVGLSIRVLKLQLLQAWNDCRRMSAWIAERSYAQPDSRLWAPFCPVSRDMLSLLHPMELPNHFIGQQKFRLCI